MTTQPIQRNADGTYKIGHGHFDTLSDLMEQLDGSAILNTSDPYAVGFQIGGLVVGLSEIFNTAADRQKITVALEDSTDPAWADAARDLAGMLLAFADGADGEHKAAKAQPALTPADQALVTELAGGAPANIDQTTEQITAIEQELAQPAAPAPATAALNDWRKGQLNRLAEMAVSDGLSPEEFVAERLLPEIDEQAKEYALNTYHYWRATSAWSGSRATKGN